MFSASFAMPSPGARAYGWLVAATNTLLTAAVLSLPGPVHESGGQAMCRPAHLAARLDNTGTADVCVVRSAQPRPAADRRGYEA